MTDIANLAIRCDSSELGRAKGAMGELSGAAGVLEGYVGKLMAVWASWKLTEHVAEMATLAARYETMGVVMNVAGNNAGYTSAEMAKLEKQMQDTGISMLGARESLTSLSTANIDLANATKLARAAQDVAVVGNVNSTEAFQRLVRGIKSGETEVLRSLGLNVQFEEGYKKLASELGKNVTQLSAQEKVQSRANQVLSESVRYQGIYEAAMGTTGKQMLSMERYVENLKIKIGELFGPALSEGVQTLTEWLKAMKDWLDKNAESAELVKGNLEGAAKNFIGIVTDTKEMIGLQSDVVDGLGLMEILSGGLALTVAVVRDVLRAVWGLVEMIVGAFEAALQPVAKFESMIVHLWGMKTPEWVDNLANGMGINHMKKGWQDLNPVSTSQFYGLGVDNSQSVLEIEKEIAAQKKLSDAERERIKAGKEAREAETTRAGEAEKAQKEAEAVKEIAKARDAMRKKLQEEADTWGLTTEQIRRYKAEQLGLGNSKELKELEDIERLRRANVLRSKEEGDEAQFAKNARAEAFAERQQQLEYEQSAIQAADDYLNPYLDGLKQYGLILEGLKLKLDQGVISQGQYNRAFEDLVKKAKADMPVMTSLFGDLRDTIQNWSQDSTDAFVDFCFTGESSFRQLVDSMLRDLARLAVQKNIMGPLFGWASDSSNWSGLWSGISGLFGGGGYDASDYNDYVPGASPIGQGGYSFSPASSSPVNSKVSVTVNQATGQVVTDTTGATSANLAKAIDVAVQRTIREQQRQGGSLAR